MTSRRRPADGRRARWETHRVARRAELIVAAIAAVRAEGAGVSMDAIAAHAGIAKPVFYRYFTDKADLHGAIGRSVADSVVRQVTRSIDGTTTPRAWLAAGIDSYLRSVERDPELYRLVVHGAPPGRPSDPVDDYASIVGVHVARIIGALLRQAGADAGAAEPWGFGIVGLVRSAADNWLSQRSMSREALVGYLCDLVEPGLVAKLPDSGRDWPERVLRLVTDDDHPDAGAEGVGPLADADHSGPRRVRHRE